MSSKAKTFLFLPSLAPEERQKKGVPEKSKYSRKAQRKHPGENLSTAEWVLLERCIRWVFSSLPQDAMLVLLLVSGYQGPHWPGGMAQDTGAAQVFTSALTSVCKHIKAQRAITNTGIAHNLCLLSSPLLTYPRSSKTLTFFNSFQNLSHINGLYSPGNTDSQTHPQKTEKMYQAKVKTIWTGKGYSCLLQVSWVVLGMSPNLNCPWHFASCYLFTI